MIEMKQRSLEEVKALSREEVVEIMRQAGIIGAGGAGFPTYIKYKDPQPRLMVNATESEPGYQADKALHKEYLDAFLSVYEALKTIFGFERVSMCVHEKDREWFSEYAEHAEGLYDMLYVPNKYSLGQEKILIHHATDAEVPWRVDMPDGSRRPGMPPDAGIIVNNSETLFNVYNALFLGKPTTTKFVSVYGEETETKVYEVPIGASMTEILRIAGTDIENSGHLSVVQGGPYLNEMGIEELGTGDDAYIRNTTNALLLIRKGATPYKEYADIKTEPPKEGLVSLVGKVSGVNLPLGGRFLEPATLLVSEGDEVEREQKIAEPAEEGFSVGVWASAGGEISSTEDNIVAISGGAVPQEEAEAEAEAEATRPVEPEEEAEAEASR
ncbi:MAG: proton-conducting membrane transporter [Actinomycetota bacterium]|nr:proton-conducting membrane transporter [Actinomycetota bacterium]